jgi:hypothetical protein
MGIPSLMARPPAHHVAHWNALDRVKAFAVRTSVAGCALLRCGIPIACGLAPAELGESDGQMQAKETPGLTHRTEVRWEG